MSAAVITRLVAIALVAGLLAWGVATFVDRAIAGVEIGGVR